MLILNIRQISYAISKQETNVLIITHTNQKFRLQVLNCKSNVLSAWQENYSF